MFTAVVGFLYRMGGSALVFNDNDELFFVDTRNVENPRCLFVIRSTPILHQHDGHT